MPPIIRVGTVGKRGQDFLLIKRWSHGGVLMKASTFVDANKLDSVNIVSSLSNAPGPDHP